MQADDSRSHGSSPPASTTGSIKTVKKEPSDKKKLKVLKNALKEERLAREELAIEVNALKQRNRELEKEHGEVNNKYLDIYEENDKLQEQIQTLQYKDQSGSTGAKVSLWSGSQLSLSV